MVILTEITNGVIRNKTLWRIIWVSLLLERRSGGTNLWIGGPNPRSERASNLKWDTFNYRVQTV
jgi:hypothetical protein